MSMNHNEKMNLPTNWSHFRTFVWLRWRIMRNQWRRFGKVNAAIMIVLAVAAVVMVVPSFLGVFALGVYKIPDASPAVLMYIWDGLVGTFLLFWGIGLITDLQRSDTLSMSKFLHLPVSVGGVFVINFVSSLTKLSLLAFVPLMLGYALASIYVKGPAMVPILGLLAAFLLMVTGVTYLFQGWLASMMSNPRRRRAIVVGFTMVFVLMCQIPNLINFTVGPAAGGGETAEYKKYTEGLTGITAELQARTITAEEATRRQKELTDAREAALTRRKQQAQERFERFALIANAAVPIGWLPLGAMAGAEGNLVPSLLGMLGLTTIGAGSLWLSYRSTVRQYQGQLTNKRPQARALPAGPATTAPGKRKASLLEVRLPGISEPVAAVTMANMAALLRAPEVKMALLMPIITIPFIGWSLYKQGQALPELVRPLVAIGGLSLALMGVMQIACNQFGMDRDGFRVLVLSSARRRDILMGKNLSFAPLALGLGLILIAVIQVVSPMRVDHFLALLPQLISMYLMVCLMTNLVSILAPMNIAAGSLKPAHPKTTTILIQMMIFLIVFPITQGLTMIPLGIEALGRALGWPEYLPIYLGLGLVEAAVLVVVYRLSLGWQGSLLAAREQKVLEVVTNRAT